MGELGRKEDSDALIPSDTRRQTEKDELCFCGGGDGGDNKSLYFQNQNYFIHFMSSSHHTSFKYA